MICGSTSVDGAHDSTSDDNDDGKYDDDSDHDEG